MYFVFLSLVLLGIGILGTLVLRKLSLLSNLEVDSLPSEREARKKKELMSRRLDAETAELQATWQARLAPVVKLWGRVQLAFRKYVGQVERLWHHEERTRIKEAVKAVSPDELEQKLTGILEQAQKYFEAAQYAKAEELYISTIKLDPKSAPAYRGLADTYAAQGALKEAKETYQFLHQLTPHDDAVLVKIAEISEGEGALDEAIEYYQMAVVENDALSPRFYHLAELLVKVGEPLTAKEAILSAVELEPKNPKYLDLLTEIGVLCGDKELAQRGFNELRLANPENQKLVEFQERIRAL